MKTLTELCPLWGLTLNMYSACWKAVFKVMYVSYSLLQSWFFGNCSETVQRNAVRKVLANHTTPMKPFIKSNLISLVFQSTAILTFESYVPFCRHTSAHSTQKWSCSRSLVALSVLYTAWPLVDDFFDTEWMDRSVIDESPEFCLQSEDSLNA